MHKNHPNTKAVVKRFIQFLRDEKILTSYKWNLKRARKKYGQHFPSRIFNPAWFAWRAFSWSDAKYGNFKFWELQHLKWQHICRSEGWMHKDYRFH